jgi:D-apiose dehydrogenase
MRRFKVAIVGCGGVSGLHVEAYTRHPDRIEVVAAIDPVLDRAEQLARGIPGCSAFSSIEGAQREATWEIGVVCSPTPIRVGVVEQLVGAGKHVFVEKPFADNLADAARMVEAAESAGVFLSVHQNFRYFYPFDAARSLISAGRIGRVTTVLHRELMFRQDEGWRTTMPRHALAVMGIHWLDGFRWMLDDEPVQVVCSLGSSPLVDARGDTEAVVQTSFAGGATASYVESFSYPGNELETVVIGEQGSLRLSSGELCEWHFAGGGAPEVRRHDHPLGGDKPEATFLALDQLLQAVETGAAPSNGGRDNLNTVAFLEAAYASAETGRPAAIKAELVR